MVLAIHENVFGFDGQLLEDRHLISASPLAQRGSTVASGLARAELLLRGASSCSRRCEFGLHPSAQGSSVSCQTSLAITCSLAIKVEGDKEIPCCVFEKPGARPMLLALFLRSRVPADARSFGAAPGKFVPCVEPGGAACSGASVAGGAPPRDVWLERAV